MEIVEIKKLLINIRKGEQLNESQASFLLRSIIYLQQTIIYYQKAIQDVGINPSLKSTYVAELQESSEIVSQLLNEFNTLTANLNGESGALKVLDIHSDPNRIAESQHGQ